MLTSLGPDGSSGRYLMVMLFQCGVVYSAAVSG